MYSLIFLMMLLGVAKFPPASGKCDIRKRGVSDEEKEDIVNKHNEYRARVANGKEKDLPKAANMLEMKWDHDLAKKAQKWAEKCEFQHSDPKDKKGKKAGQNIAWQSKTDKKPVWNDTIKDFFAEMKDFDKNTIKKFKLEEKTGHFTQMIWAKSYKVGCGFVRHREENKSKFLYGCNYAPRGNMEPKPIYKEGKPCSKCGGCGSTKGLCKNKKRSKKH